MRHRSTTRGFTIIETMIFLVVSSFVFVGAIAQYTSQQHRVEFTQGVRGLQAQLLTTISEVGSSFAPDMSPYKCTADDLNGPLSFAALPGPNDNSDCVFLGKAIAFGGDGAGAYCTGSTDARCSHYAVIPIAGRREYFATPGSGAGLPVKSLIEALPFALASCSTDPATPAEYVTSFPCGTAPVAPSPLHPNFGSRDKFEQNVSVSKVFTRNSDGSVNRPIGGFAFVFNLSSSDTVSSSNVSSLDLVSLDRASAPLPFLNNTLSKSITAVDNLKNVAATQINPPYGISVCIVNGFGMKALLTVGANQSKLDVQVVPADSPELGQCPS